MEICFRCGLHRSFCRSFFLFRGCHIEVEHVVDIEELKKPALHAYVIHFPFDARMVKIRSSQASK